VTLSWSPESLVRNDKDGKVGAYHVCAIRLLLNRSSQRMKFKLVDYACFYWPILLANHFKDPHNVFHLLISLEDLIEELKEIDYSYKWAMSDYVNGTDRVIKCLEQCVGIISLQRQ
jgi:hypothetical protein